MLPGRMQMLWRRAQARSVAGCVEGAADKCGQQTDLGCDRCRGAICERWAEICATAVHVSPCFKCGNVGVGEGVQVGGGSGEDTAMRCRGKEGGSECLEGKVGDANAPLSKRKMEL
jgi:hypothetical protein